MTTQEQIAAYEARREAAIGQLARAKAQREIDEAWRLINWLDEQVLRIRVTPASAAQMR